MANTRLSIPGVTAENGLSRYMETIKRYPLLSLEEEQSLAVSYNKTGDLQAAERLITSHLRLVAKIAMGYRFYGLPVSDLISEGNIGLLRAVNKFEPERGFRLATYAIWWIKASLNEYILASWSLVKIGTISAQKKLFFRLLRLKAKLGIYSESDLTPEQADWIAEKLTVPSSEVLSMNQRMSQDSSLNTTVGEDSDLQRIDLLVDERPDQEEILGERQERTLGTRLLKDAMKILNPRERSILSERRLTTAPATLENLGKKYGISRERVRQIENRAFTKLQSAVTKAATALNYHGTSPALS